MSVAGWDCNNENDKEVSCFKGLSGTFKDLDQIPALPRPGKCDFKIQELSRICNTTLTFPVNLATYVGTGFCIRRSYIMELSA